MSDLFGFGKGRNDNTDESVQEILQAMSAYFPGIAESLRGQYEPQAQAELDIARKYSPELNSINTGLLDTAGRDVSKIGRELSREEQLSAAQTEADILAGPGKQAASSAIELQKATDPEYFKNRELLMSELDKSFNAMGNDPNQLSRGEMEQITRGLGRTNWGVSSPAQTAANAMVFGDAAAKRRAEYNNLINLRSNVTPQLRSGIDAAGIASRRTVLPNFGQQNYVGLQTPGVNTANTLGASFMNNAFATDQNRQNVYAGMNKGAGIGGGIGKLVGSIAAGAACWVAREVYGEESPYWRVFRGWLFEDAPSWLREMYIKHGRDFAIWLKGKTLAKNIIRRLMDIAVRAKLNR